MHIKQGGSGISTEVKKVDNTDITTIRCTDVSANAGRKFKDYKAQKFIHTEQCRAGGTVAVLSKFKKSGNFLYTFI